MGFSPFRPVGLIHHDRERAFAGYTLLCNIYGRSARLVDMNGAVVHEWTPPDPSWLTYTCELLETGNLLLLCVTPNVYKPGGCGVLLELDPESRVVWSYEDPWLHHAFSRRKNGNTMVLRWEHIPEELAHRVRQRRDRKPVAGSTEPMLGDAIIELNPQKEVVWQWRSWEALDPDVDRPCPLHLWEEWSHCNSFQELPSGDLAVCFRITDTVAIVSRTTGRFTWKWGAGILGHPHDVSILPGGRLLLFDNEWHAVGKLDHSSVIEIDTASSEVVWTYRGSPLTSFSSAHLGGAQRLPNGNTLICEGSTGRIFEVTRAGDIVWEFTNPVTCHYREDTASPRIFRVSRYGTDFPGLPGRRR